MRLPPGARPGLALLRRQGEAPRVSRAAAPCPSRFPLRGRAASSLRSFQGRHVISMNLASGLAAAVASSGAGVAGGLLLSAAPGRASTRGEARRGLAVRCSADAAPIRPPACLPAWGIPGGQRFSAASAGLAFLRAPRCVWGSPARPCLAAAAAAAARRAEMSLGFPASGSLLQRSSSSEGTPQGHEDDERKVRRREKNRVAAQRSRKKQTQKADKLHEEYECLEQENTSLKREIGKLTDEMKQLTEVLRDHEKICPLLHRSLNFGLMTRHDALSGSLPR
ncbi:basic leucine zipper transcriptional factor ATF-like 3 [Paroedura picta]|uniref:basic leucine zipper transcriptional factor ATF-like 3 n=1 Tax=Paroedura picta TaxID=143630 RepID=UPI0040578F87